MAICINKETGLNPDYSNYDGSLRNSRGIIGDQFNVDGSTPERILSAGGYTKLRHSVGLVATLATASIISDNPHRMEFVERLWNSSHQPYEDGYYDAYYDGLLQLFAFMHLSGKYNIIHIKGKLFFSFPLILSWR